MALEVRIDAKRGTTHLRVDVTLARPWTVIFGPSGSGKSSILRAIAGLWNPVGIAITLNGGSTTQTPPHQRHAPLLAQNPKLFPQKSAYANVMFKIASTGGSTSDCVNQLLEDFGMRDLKDKFPAQLSGGQQQRLALARALATDPRLLLLDETFSGTDAVHRAGIIRLLKRRLPDSPRQIISVTHDVAEAFECADEVIKLQDGKIIAQGPPSQVLATERDALLQQLNAPIPSKIP